jgi:hypothetical protein
MGHYLFERLSPKVVARSDVSPIVVHESIVVSKSIPVDSLVRLGRQRSTSLIKKKQQQEEAPSTPPPSPRRSLRRAAGKKLEQ